MYCFINPRRGCGSCEYAELCYLPDDHEQEGHWEGELGYA